MMQTDAILDMTSRIVSSYAGRNEFGIADLPGVIRSVHGTLASLADSCGKTEAVPDRVPVEAIEEARPDTEDGLYRGGRRTFFEDRIVCLEDGKEVVFLTRHLNRLGVTPEQYRAKWGLPPSYPMVAPAYADRKRSLAIAAGLGKVDGIRPRLARPEPDRPCMDAAETPPLRTGPDALTLPLDQPVQAAGQSRRRRRSGTLSPAYG